MNFKSPFSGFRREFITDEVGVHAGNQAATAPAFSAPSEPPAPSKKEAPYPWILHPAIDLFFCCGGLFWLLMIATFVIGIKVDVGTALILNIVGNVLFIGPHQPATLFRVYESERTRKSVGVLVTAWGAFVIAFSAAALYSNLILGFFLLITLSWGLQHVLAQVYGIVLIYCYKRQYIMNTHEKRSLFLLTQAALLFFVVRFFSYTHAYKGFQLPNIGRFPDWVLFGAGLAFQAAALYFVFMVVRKWVKERKLFPLPALLTLLTGILPTLIFTSPIVAIFIQSFFHSAQYNVVTASYFLKEKGLPEGVPYSKIATQLLSRRALKYFGFLFLLGLLLSVCLPVAFVLAGFTTAGLVANCAINMHHYFTDAAIWRMKDPVVRKLLVS